MQKITMQKFEKAFLSQRAGISILDFLADELPLSKTKLKEVIQKGAVWLQREEQEPERLRRAKEPVKLYDEIHIYYDESFLNITLPPLRCVESYGQYSIWYKPYGLMDEMTLYGDHLSLERALIRDVPHDLDCYFLDPEKANISGLMLIAHTQDATSKLLEQWQNQQIIKDYQMIISGKFSEEPISLIYGKQTISLSLESYNSYNDTSLVSIKNATGIESYIKELLLNNGYKIPDDEELVCSRIAFVSPINNEPVEYTIKQDA